MLKKGKKIDKKHTMTFEVVSRSQQDPLINYEDAPQSVLVPNEDSRKRKEVQHSYGIYYDDDYDYLQHLKDVKDTKREYEITEVYDKKSKKYVRFDDLNSKTLASGKEVDDERPTTSKLQLPSSLFESGIKESVGMLNKSMLSDVFQPEWDVDVVRALADDFTFEDSDNEIDDDFVLQAQGGDIEKVDFEELEEEEIDPKIFEKLKLAKQNYRRKTSESSKENNVFESNNADSDRASFGSDRDSLKSDDNFNDRFTYRSLGSESQFTNYPMSSSVCPRNQRSTDLYEQFEQFYLNNYAYEIEPEFERDLDPKILNQFVNERLMFKRNNKETKTEQEKVEINQDIPKESILKIAEMQAMQDSDDEEQEEIVLQAGMGKNDFDNRWDCESILSTYSNLYNHPKLISENQPRKIKINRKTGVPEGVIGSQLSAKALKQLIKMTETQQEADERSVRSAISMMSQLTVRNDQETPEERRQRKKNLKEYMRERRVEKKANKEAFKSEHLRQQKESITNRTVGAMKMV